MTQLANFAFLHGGGQGSWIWDETLAALESQFADTPYNAEAFDLPGCGNKRAIDTASLTTRDVAASFANDLLLSIRFVTIRLKSMKH